ncbi:DNA replication initiation ATPase [uncultured Mediterranean phage uvMED]|nr:DNA replication initiation ATPase [uncultured Mediterranean phage uvMED]
MMILELKQKIEKDWNVNLSDRCRNRKLSYLRAIYFYVAYNITGTPTAYLGATVDRDHTTVLYALKNIIDVIAYTEPELQDYKEELMVWGRSTDEKIAELKAKIKRLEKQIERLQVCS